MRLTLIDTAGIQQFVFASNRLKENLGASYLVDCATGEWVKKHIGSGKIIYCGGGNALLYFDQSSDEEKFIRDYSRHLLVEAPGLQVVIRGVDFDMAKDPVAGKNGKLAELQQAVKRAKQVPTVSVSLHGLAVTAQCLSTGLPAVGYADVSGGETILASAQTIAKLSASDKAKQRLEESMEPGAGYSFPDDLDDMGRSHGEHSFVAVVHADGDGIGARVKALSENPKYATPDKNEEFFVELKNFSEKLNQSASGALKQTLEKLKGSIQCEKIEDGEISIKLKDRGKGNIVLPFRPIVFGGDDVTFVCDGRIGISLALEYMKNFEKQTENLPDGSGSNKTATVCAGIAIVKSHYPFARAYELAEELCKNAKVHKKEDGVQASCLDWHFAVSGLNSDLPTIREREYRTPSGSLALRPVSASGPSERSWDVIHKGVRAFRGKGWEGRRNKIKALRDVLREGAGAVKDFITHYNEGEKLPEVYPPYTDWKSEGWQGKFCGYFDAIELVDWHIDLKDMQKQDGV